MGLYGPGSDKSEMFVEDLAVLFVIVLRFQVERLTETLGALQVRVAGPLYFAWGDKCLKGNPCVDRWWWQAGCCERRTGIPKKRRAFDCTLGYPGEDVPTLLTSA